MGLAPTAGSPLVLALDTDDLEQAVAWSRAAGEAAGMVKVGLELFAAHGPAAVGTLAGAGRRVMLDLKLHDIPVTVAGAIRAAVRAGAELVTVHALGGPAMLAAAVQAAGDRCRVAAVTILTSAAPADLAAAGLPAAADAVPRLAELAVRAGCRAVVCSPLEAGTLRALLGPAVELVCPGVRPMGTWGSGGLKPRPPVGRGLEPHAGRPQGEADDQARVASPAEAMAAGATWIVVGRPITRSDDVGAAARAVRDQAVAATAGQGGDERAKAPKASQSPSRFDGLLTEEGSDQRR
jgi:orotidine-5'-phosphate decarboxylase